MINDETLDGITGIGPARRAALEAAGITTRTALRDVGAVELTRLTRMPRVQAEQVITALQSVPEVALPSTDEPSADVSPTAEIDVPDAVEEISEPATTEEPAEAEMPVVESSLHTAISRLYATIQVLGGRADAVRLGKRLTRMNLLLDKLPGRAVDLSERRLSRLTERLDLLSGRFEKITRRDTPLTPKREKRLRERMREDRRAILDLLRRPQRPPASKSIRRAKSGKAK